jgi:acyl transferase domain-containing protein/aryl carrier-like protein
MALAVQRLRREHPESQMLLQEPIAVIGMGCRFPGGIRTPQEFWQFLRNGGDGISDVPGERWSIEKLYDPDPQRPGKVSTRRGGFLDAPELFDPVLFGIAPREASSMDPLQRLLLEVSWEALWDSGIAPHRLAGSRTGVFAAILNSDYSHLLISDRDAINAHTCAGKSDSIASGRISYLLDLRGPSVSLDTACSSSLVAIHLACQSLRTFESNMAIAGGASLNLAPEHLMSLTRMGMLAPDGRCKTFDSRADGFVPGEGCGVVVLKRLSDAFAGGDRVLAVIRGTAVNQDGRTSVLTAPNGLAQQEVIRAALANAGVSPADITYVETHGTGTALGDPIEVEALGQVLDQAGPEVEPCILGAVKTNLGHLEAAAGVAGLIKAVLSLRNGEIPANLHFEQLNPHIALEGSRFRIPVQTQPWTRQGKPRFAGVSSFGFSGTNAHAILEEAPRLPDPTARPAEPAAVLLAVSARGPEALREFAARYRDLLDARDSGSSVPVYDVCCNAALRRSHYEERLAVAGESREELSARLQDFLEGRPAAAVACGRAAYVGEGVVFAFSGQGSQWPGMGMQLLAAEPVFHGAIEECDRLVRQHAGWSLIEQLAAAQPDSQLSRTAIAQPAIFATQVALARLWQAWGIVPAAVIGHSVGEIAAAHIAGVLDLGEAVRVAVERGRCMDRAGNTGAMAAVHLPADAVTADLSDAVCIAAINSPVSTVVSGDRSAVEALVEAWRGRGVHCRLLDVAYAFHSPQMESLSRDFGDAIGEVKTHSAAIPMVSSVLGRLVEGGQLDTAYWTANIRKPVMFAAAAERALAMGFSAFLEIGTHPVLAPALTEVLSAADRPGTVMASLRRGRDERSSLLQSAGTLYVQGQPVDWKALYPRQARTCDLPVYPYQRKRYWMEKAKAPTRLEAGTGANPLAGRRVRSPLITSVVYESTISLAAAPYLADHRIGGAVILPMTAWMELVLEAASQMAGPAARVIEDLAISEPLVLSWEQDRTVQVILEGEGFQTFSLSDNRWKLHAQGRVRTLDEGTAAIAASRPNAAGRAVSIKEFYRKWAGHGLEFGPAFRRIQALWEEPGEASSRVSIDDAEPSRGYLFHPSLLDGCVQTVLAASECAGEHCWVPFGLDQFRAWHPAGGTVWSHARVHRPSGPDQGMLSADIDVFGEDGELLAEIRGLRLRVARAAKVQGHLHRVCWRANDPVRGQKTDGQVRRWLIAGDAPHTAGKLAEALRRYGAEAAVAADGTQDLEDPPPGIVYLAGVDADVEPGVAMAEGQGAGCEALLGILQAVMRKPATQTRIVVVTRAAVPVLASDLCQGIAHSPEWGFARTMAVEHPEIECTSIDLDSGQPDVNTLAAGILHPDGESELAFRGSTRYVARLESIRAGGEEPHRLEIRTRGSIDNLETVRLNRTAPGRGEIEVEVETSALNFRDVLNVLGMYPGDPGQPGLEFCGRVIRTGDGVEDFRSGDAVTGIAWGSFADYVTTPAAFVMNVPDGMDAEAAVTLPNALLTAYHCLVHLSGMAPRAHVLIHAATGGVGLAAVQLAQRAGAEVFATAGSEEKRAYLRSLGITHVMDSRTPNFAEEVLRLTGGAGVDVVLNSLAGEMIGAGFAALAQGGRFIEIGKTGIWTDEQVAGLGRDIRYSVVDMADVLNQEPELIRSHLAEIYRALQDGSLRALPKRVYGFDDAAAAFRHMAQARHIGKIVLRHRAAGLRVSAEATYLVTGGMGGLGLRVARWLADRGAGNIVLAGRHAPSGQALAEIEDLRRSGACVQARAVDVSQRDQVDALIQAIGRDMPPLRGVFHAAGVLDDGPLVQQSSERFERVMGPKAVGAWNLHEATRQQPLDWLILFSSVASVLGSAGQASYAAANRFLDVLAHYRRSRGLPALSVNWGAWAEVGMAAQVEARGVRRTLPGIRPMSPQACLTSLELAGVLDLPQVMIADADWSRWQPVPSLLEALAVAAGPAKPAVAKDDIADVLSRAPAANKRPLLIAYLREQAARILGLSPSQYIDERQPLLSLGLDSLMAVEFRNRLAASLEKPLSATLLFDHPTLAALSAFLLPCDAAAVQDGGDVHLADVAALSEQEAEDALAAELERTS